MRTLTGRLVLVAVLLVAVVAGGIALATTLSMRAYLSGQLDDRVTAAARSLDRSPATAAPAAGRATRPPGPRSSLPLGDGAQVAIVVRGGYDQEERLEHRAGRRPAAGG